LRRRFPSQVKVGSVEEIANLVNRALPGVLLQPVPTAPPQIPFHAGFVYFEFDQTDKMWEVIKGSGSIAFHVSGEFPGLAMELWAIRT
jgi:type VI secretion system protein ImpJ